jgi:hypothetical protein
MTYYIALLKTQTDEKVISGLSFGEAIQYLNDMVGQSKHVTEALILEDPITKGVCKLVASVRIVR